MHVLVMYWWHFLKTSVKIYAGGYIVAICTNMAVKSLLLHLNQAIAIAGRKWFYSRITLVCLKITYMLPRWTSKLISWQLHCLYCYRLDGQLVTVLS